MKNLVFPRIFLHCVALGFIVSGLLLSDRPLVRAQPGVPKALLQAIFLMVCSFFVAFFLLPVFVFTEEKYTPYNECLLIGFERFSQAC